MLSVDSKKRQLLLWSGFFFGLGFLTKQNALVFVGFPIVYLGWVLSKQPHQNRKHWFDVYLFFTGGFFIPFFISGLTFLGTGSWNQMFFWTFIMPKEMTPQISISKAIYQFTILVTPIIKSSPLFFGAAAIGLLSPLWDKKSLSATTFIILFWAFSFFTMSSVFYFRAHYFLYIFPATALLTGIGFYSINGLIKKTPLIKINNLIITGLVLVFFSYSVLDQRKFLFQTSPRTASRMIYGDNPFPESLIIADYVRKHSSPGEQVAILGSEPQILFYAARMSASKHIFKILPDGESPACA